MAKFNIRGGESLQGTYSCSGAKNAGPKLIIAAMLSDSDVTLHNIPRISDTEKIMKAVNEMGGSAKWIDDHSVLVNCKDLNSHEVPQVVLSARHAVLFIGATLARLGELKIEKIGGDDIGKRPVDRLVAGLKKIGAETSETDNWLSMKMPDRPQGTEYTFAKNTHTGTESLILGSVFADGVVTIHNGAEEPEIDNLIEFLNMLGASVHRTGHRTINVTGVPKFLGGGEMESVYDRLEGATAIALAVMNGGGITVENVDRAMVKDFTDILEDIGVEFSWDGSSVEVRELNDPLKPTTVKTSIYPGFMTDWQPVMTLLLAYKAHGRSTIHEMIYEQRWSALRELGKMGVYYELYQPDGYTSSDYNFNETEFNQVDPYGAYVEGPTALKGASIESHDVRAGIAVLLAALFAEGESEIDDQDCHIDRGYEDIVGKLTKLGARIERKD